MYNSGGGWRYDRVGAQSQSAIENAVRLGPIFELKALRVRYAVAAGADVVTDLNDESRFCKHIGPEIEALRILGQSAMRRSHPIMLDVADELAARWDSRAGADTVDVSVDNTRVTLDTIGRCAAGYSFGAFHTEAVHPFVEHMVSGLKGADRAGVLRASWLPKFIARREERKVRRDGAHMNAIADEIIAKRRQQGLGHHDDLLELMLASDLDVASIRCQLINFLVARHETTSGARATGRWR